MSRWLLVELTPEHEHGIVRAFVFAIVRIVEGVAQVQDLSMISRATLDQWLLPHEQTYEFQRVGKTRVRKHQARLL